MADAATGDLTAGTLPGGAELFHGVQSSNSRKFTATQLNAAAGTAATYGSCVALYRLVG